MSDPATPRILFITGTDTGVGKTLLTGLLVRHLRQSGCHALAMKPFASGSRCDAEFLRAAQENELTLDEINPFYFAQPVAPLAAIRRHGDLVSLADVVRRIQCLSGRCEWLLVEGIGGVMVPLGERYSVLDLIAKLGCSTVVVARNHLGTINHTLLTCAALQHAGIRELRVILMACRKADSSAGSNHEMLSRLLAPRPVFGVPFLGRNVVHLGLLGGAQKKLKKTLAQILA